MSLRTETKTRPDAEEEYRNVMVLMGSSSHLLHITDATVEMLTKDTCLIMGKYVFWNHFIVSLYVLCTVNHFVMLGKM